MNKYFLYARKSTDEEERQILSIEAQITELKEFATKEKLEIADSFQESKTAKKPGRTLFGEMLDRIEKGEADGILAWHPDRLARNSVDGGKIIYMVDTGKIKFLKFPTFWFDATPQGKFMLNIAFGQSKYYIDNLSENVKRGFRQKVRNGVYPGHAHFGYINNLRHHNIALDPIKHKIAKRIFELYSTGEYALEDLVYKFDLRTKTGKRVMGAQVQFLLKNPFYYGVFKYKGEIYKGIHEPIISKKLFDQCQEVMAQRSKGRRNKNHGFVFTGLMKCGTCGRSITAEEQKGHTYYRCTKKRTVCNEKYTREEDLLPQIRNFIQKVSLKSDWATYMLNRLEKEKKEQAQSSFALALEVENQKTLLDQKLDHLLDSHIDGAVDKNAYIKKKEKFLNEKIDLEDKIKEIKSKGVN